MDCVRYDTRNVPLDFSKASARKCRLNIALQCYIQSSGHWVSPSWYNTLWATSTAGDLKGVFVQGGLKGNKSHGFEPMHPYELQITNLY